MTARCSKWCAGWRRCGVRVTAYARMALAVGWLGADTAPQPTACCRPAAGSAHPRHSSRGSLVCSPSRHPPHHLTVRGQDASGGQGVERGVDHRGAQGHALTRPTSAAERLHAAAAGRRAAGAWLSALGRPPSQQLLIGMRAPQLAPCSSCGLRLPGQPPLFDRSHFCTLPFIITSALRPLLPQATRTHALCPDQRMHVRKLCKRLPSSRHSPPPAARP